MNGLPPADDLLEALRRLPGCDSDRARSRALVERATRTMARRRRTAERRVVVLAGVYGRAVTPIAVGALSIGFIAAVLAQAISVLRHATIPLLW